MEIANIITEDKIDIGPEFNVVTSLDEIIFKDLPTLIIGYDLVKLFFDKSLINVLNKRINKNTFWTFNRNVKRDVFTNDLEDFIRHSYTKCIERINYVDIDLIQFSRGKIIKILRKIKELENIITYKSKNNVIYMYSENLIFGIDLNIVDFIGYDSKKIEDRIRAESIKFLEGDEILLEYGNHLERINNGIKYIPLLYSINPHE